MTQTMETKELSPTDPLLHTQEVTGSSPVAPTTTPLILNGGEPAPATGDLLPNEGRRSLTAYKPPRETAARIVTSCDRPAIPIRDSFHIRWCSHDWQAWREWRKSGEPVGFGATVDDAIADLLEQEAAHG